jgi:hypothetical protein
MTGVRESRDYGWPVVKLHFMLSLQEATGDSSSPERLLRCPDDLSIALLLRQLREPELWSVLASTGSGALVATKPRTKSERLADTAYLWSVADLLRHTASLGCLGGECV